jgi:hypothetical protein
LAVVRKKKPLSETITETLAEAPPGWDRSIILTQDRDLLGQTVTMMDVRYVLDEADPEAPADVERVSTKELVSGLQLTRSASPDEFYRLLLATMAGDLERAHEEGPSDG